MRLMRLSFHAKHLLERDPETIAIVVKKEDL